MYIPDGSYLSLRSCHSLHLLLTLGISASMAGYWAWAAAILWWAAFPPVPPRWCCNRGSFPPSQWPGSTHRFIVKSCRNKGAIGSWNGKDKYKCYFKHLRRLNCWGSSLLLSTRSAFLLKPVYVYVFSTLNCLALTSGSQLVFTHMHT